MEQLTPDHVLLGLLAAEPCHGYQLIDIFRQEEQLGRVWQMSNSQIYAVLKRLEKKYWIVGQEKVIGEAPPRTIYTLTDIGRAELENWLYISEPSASIRRIRVEFLSRLYIARLLNSPSTQIVHAQKAACLQRREVLLAQRDQGEQGMAVLALEFIIAQLDAVLQWIERCDLVPQGLEDE